jgi:hypothetical protein
MHLQQKGRTGVTEPSASRQVFHHTTLSTSMQLITFTVIWQWTCILAAALVVVPIVVFLTMRPPRLLSSCNPVPFNSTTYQEMCDSPYEDHIILFCIVSSRCHTYFTNMSQATMHEEQACLSLDYHMDCNWLRARQ